MNNSSHISEIRLWLGWIGAVAVNKRENSLNVFIYEINRTGKISQYDMTWEIQNPRISLNGCVCVCICGGWLEDDSSIVGVIEVRGIDETSTLMSFSQLIHRFTCKWPQKGYWLQLPSACTYHANVSLSDTSTHMQNLGVERWKVWKSDMAAWLLIDCSASHYQ